MENFLVLLVVVLGCSYIGIAKGDQAVDVESLMGFKDMITHDPLHVLHNWTLGPESPHYMHCNWSGVTCSSKHPGRVVSLVLNNASLQGSISPLIGNLSFLQCLNLSNNFFTGIMPPSLGNLHRLKFLDVHSNRLKGDIPSQLGYLQSLQVLSAFKNSIHGSIPSSLSNCSKLHVLDLSSNQISGLIPEFIGSFSNLNFLNLKYNSLTGTIPMSLVNASALRILNLNFNHLHDSIPSSIGMLNKLEELYMTDNMFSGEIPRSLSNATKLRILRVTHNFLQGTVPLTFSQLANLEILDVFDNNIVSGVSSPHQPIPIIQALYNNSKLRKLGLAYNKLEGVLPSDIGLLSKNLQYLFLYANEISGTIPISIGNLSSLILLNLGNNHFKRSIPRSIGRLKSLQFLKLCNNMLEGTIPIELTLLHATLDRMDLYNNHLSGRIPTYIGKLTNIRYLNLSKNSFSGTIPSELGRCWLLEDLLLSSNNLSGKIPTEVANLRNILGYFDLSSNALSGIVPAEIGGMQMATYIDLSRNQLSGDIVIHMADWLNAGHINLSFNSFSGILPESIGAKLAGLKVLDLSHNNFSGRVPHSMYNHSDFQFLNFSYNNLEGSISCIGAFKMVNPSAFFGNPLLCSSCFNLPCLLGQGEHHSNSHKTGMIIRIIVPVIVVGVLCIAILFCLCLLNKRKGNQYSNMFTTNNNFFLGISQEELVEATNNFSAANLIGKGSHGDVYSGILTTGEMVAVKIFTSSDQQSSASSFLRECQTLGKIRHRNLMKIITVCCEYNFRAMVLPLMQRGNLDNLLHDKGEDEFLVPITMKMCIKIIRELASALGYLHHDCSPSIVHCDVKPENVLLDTDMTVKLSDFGIARIMGTYPSSSTVSLNGTIGYLAPEYGICGDVSVKGDVYSFGIVVLEIMTRQKPTDDRFSGNLSIVQWLCTALADENKANLASIVLIEYDNKEEWKMIQGLIKVGLLCCAPVPEQRPTMKEVERLLFMLPNL